ncbi:unnamed protein product [Moneuplotes crassus]|uniref:Uncharacterized protein n=1 Tax=Euplotes crassus TaxID=5936 RepID=A0AAD1XVE6_EUPCR|nr:unnamed protein product [Moneuplotes crassus]
MKGTKGRTSRVEQLNKINRVFEKLRKDRTSSMTNSGSQTNCSSIKYKVNKSKFGERSLSTSLSKKLEFPKIRTPAPKLENVIRRLQTKEFYIKRSAYEILEDAPRNIQEPCMIIKDRKAIRMRNHKKVIKNNLRYKKNEILKQFHNRMYAAELDKYVNNKISLFAKRKKFHENTSLSGLADVSMAYLART